MTNPKLIEEPQTDQEALIAYWIENASPWDLDLLSSLVDTYGEDMYRLACFLLAYGKWDDDISGKSKDLTVVAMRQAISKLDSFRAAPSVRSWLFAQIIKSSRSFQLRLKWLIKPPESNIDRMVIDYDITSDESRLNLLEQWQILSDLTTLEALVFCLCAGFELTIEETAYVLQHDEADIKDLLIESSFKLQGKYAGAVDRENLDLDFRRYLVVKWKAPNSSDLMQFLYKTRDTERLATPNIPSRIYEKLMEVLVILFALLAGIIAVWYFTSGDYSSGKPLFPTQAKATSTAIVITDLEARNAPVAIETEIQFSYHLEPDLSDDGRWLVFTHFDRLQSADIYLADLHTGDLNHLDADIDGYNTVDSTGDHESSNNPKISADGRFVLFASNKFHLYTGDPPICFWRSTNISCFNIYLYDREKETLELITQVDNGSPADGHSLMPIISPDGKWIAFWSSANNLTQDHRQTCGEDSQNCWDVYLYNRETGDINRLPIGRRRDSIDIVRIFPLSMSDDGSRLGLTIYSDDQIAEALSFKNSSEVYVYDWNDLKLHPVAVNDSGQPGVGDSFLPVLSADGRFVAFVSEADQLLDDDRNGFADVFVRDLEKEITELVSISPKGEPGNGYSGVLPGDSIMWGEQIDISAGGRYVTFLSSASNLSEIQGEGCRASQFSYCSEVYIHDRITKSTTTVIQQPRGDGFFLFPGLSGEGTTVWYVHYHHNCSRAPYCTDVLFFDPQSAMTVAPLATGYHIVQDYPGDWQSTRFLDAGSGGGVHSLAFSPDGTTLAAGLSDGHIRLWNIPDGSLRNALKIHKRPVESVIYDPTGAVLVSGSHDGTLSYWSAVDDTLLRHLPGNAGAIFDLDFSPDGYVLTIAGQRGTMNWDVRDLFFGMLNFIEYPNEQVRSIAISPDGKLIAHGLSSGSLWLLEVNGMQSVLRLAAHDDLVTSLEFSSNGKLLASGSRDGKAKIWSLQQEGKTWSIELVLVTQQNDWVNDVAFSPDGRWLGVVAFKSDIHLWSVPGGDSQDYALNADGYQPLSIDFSQDGRWLAAGSSWSGVRIWEVPQH